MQCRPCPAAEGCEYDCHSLRTAATADRESGCLCTTTELAFARSMRRESLNPSSAPKKPRAPAWDCGSARESFRSTQVRSSFEACFLEIPLRLASPCLSRPRVRLRGTKWELH